MGTILGLPLLWRPLFRAVLAHNSGIDLHALTLKDDMDI